METPRILFAACLTLSPLLGGCLDNGAAEVQASPDPADPPTQTAANPSPDQMGLARGAWTRGDWWQVHAVVDMGFLEFLEFEGKLVVRQTGSEGYALVADNVDIGVFDQYFDSFYQGPVDFDLNPVVRGQALRMYDWPLLEGKNWSTPFLGQNIFSRRLTVADLHVAAFDPEEHGPTARLRIQGETLEGALVDYDYDPATGWMTYFRMTNKTSGRIWLSLDVTASGHDFHGDVHAISARVLYLSMKMLPPFDPDATAPRPESAAVPDGYDFLEYIRYVFVYPIEEPAAAGAALVSIMEPGGRLESTKTEGVFEFRGQFERNRVPDYEPGNYEILYALAGTSGAFCQITGFKDEVSRI